MPHVRVALIIAGLLAAGLIVSSGKEGALVLAEKTALLFSPDAARAYGYGTRHLDARSYPGAYNIDASAYFFARASALNPAYPYLAHQRARVAFLRGNFPVALAFVDQEIARYGEDHANSFYMRGLIKGFRGDYAGAARDYEVYLKHDPYNWAALNDYAWVLLKADRPAEAERATREGLAFHPANPWLLNSHAIALHEIGRSGEALIEARDALARAGNVSEEDWLLSYPGNDPRVAREGIAALQSSIRSNIHTLSLVAE